MQTTISRRIISIALVTALTGGALAGCSTQTSSSSNSSGPTAAAGANPSTSSPGGDNSAASSAPMVTTIPQPLTDIASDASTIFDAALAKDWPTVTKAASSLTGSWSALSSEKQTGVPDGLATELDQTIKSLEEASAREDAQGAAQAANDISGAAAAAMDQIGTNRPVEIDRLGVIARQLILDADAGRWPDVKMTMERADKDLKALQKTLESHGGTQVYQDLMKSMDQLAAAAKAKDAATVRIHATELLDSTGVMQGLFN